jgi:group I intron endonuclease
MAFNKNMKHSGIYKIVNKVNGLVYIGSSKSIESRFWGHKTSLRRKEHHSTHLQYAWLKYGEENFNFEILEDIQNPTKELLESREQYWIDYYNSADKKFGYNVCKKAYSCFGVERAERDKTKNNKQLILEFCKINGHRPSRKAQNFKERHLGNLLESYIKCIHDSYDPKFREIVLVYPSSRTYKSSVVKDNILKLIDTFGHLPSRDSKNKEESKLGKILSYIKDSNSEIYDPVLANRISGIPTAQRFKKLLKV